MDVETQWLAEQLDDSEKIAVAGWEFHKGTVAGYPVIVSRTYIGMTNAAVATTLGIEHFDPIAIINQGTAGGHDPALHRSDLVLGKNIVNFGAYKSDWRGKGGEIAPTAWQPMTVEILVNGVLADFSSLESDPDLLEIALSLKDRYSKGNVVEGTIGSADEWNKELDRIAWIHETWGTSGEEMETFSAAQVAKAYAVPFLSIRILSNHEVHIEEYDRNTGMDCQAYVLEIVKTLIAGMAQ